MQRFKQFIAEAKVDGYFHSWNAEVTPYYRCRTAASLKGALAACKGSLRGYVFDDYVDVWDGDIALHSDYQTGVGATGHFAVYIIKAGSTIELTPSFTSQVKPLESSAIVYKLGMRVCKV